MFVIVSTTVIIIKLIVCFKIRGMFASRTWTKRNAVPLHQFWFFICTMMWWVMLCDSLSYKYDFTWIENDDRGDCIVVIVSKGKPVATGVWISLWTVLTARNPFMNMPPRGKINYNIQIHSINGSFSYSQYHHISCYRDAVCGYNRRSHWIRHGFDHKNSPLHDLMTFTVQVPRTGWKHYPARLVQNAGNRYPFYVQMPFGNETIGQTHDLLFGGFGYIDKQHVEDNIKLEIEFYKGSMLEDCDEWLPRAWGLFICVLNVDGFIGIGAGMPLIVGGYLVGIGSFEFQKNNASILVFTDLRQYIRNRDICICYYDYEDRKAIDYRHNAHQTETIPEKFESFYPELLPENDRPKFTNKAQALHW